MKRFVWLLVAFLSTPCVASEGVAPASAPPTDETRAEMYRRYAEFPSLVRGGRVAPMWSPDGRGLWFLDGEGDEAAVWRADAEHGRRPAELKIAALRAALARHLDQAPSARGVPFDRLETAGDGTFELIVGDRRFLWDPTSTVLEPRPPPDEARPVRPPRFPGFPPVHELPSPNGRWFLTESDHDLAVRSTGTDDLVALTDDGTPEVDWRLAQDDLWTEARWSPDSRTVAALREDRRDQPREPIVDWLPRHPTVEWVPFSKSGEPLARTEIWLIDLPTAERPAPRRRRVDLGDTTDRYFHLVTFTRDGRELLLLDADRLFKRVRLLAADRASGRVRTVIDERQDTFVKNMSLRPQWVELPTVLRTRDEVLWISERDGFDHLYRYDLEGRLLGRLTSGAFPLVKVVTVDEEAGQVYVLAHGEQHPYETHLYRVPLEPPQFDDPSTAGPTALVRLTDDPGVHHVVFSPDLSLFLDHHSRYDRAPRTDLYRADGTFVATLAEANVSALDALHWRAPEPFVVKAADGETDLHGLLYKPWDFDPSKRYPVIEHIYAGPFMTYVPWGFVGNRITGTVTQALAQLGYVTFLVDGRGTPERGKAFQDHSYAAFGQVEIEDHLAALRHLAAERPYIDLDRVGVFGGSWGGYMTVRAMLTEPDVYKVGIATNPLYDFWDHGAEGLEGYLGAFPQDDPDGVYAGGSSIDQVERLRGHLLLVHATGDRNATLSATMKFLDALVRAGKPYDLVLLPGQDHHPRGYAHRYRLQVHRRYFLEHLPP